MSKWVSFGIFLVAAAVTSLFFINFCATVFQCGCQSLWGAAAKLATTPTPAHKVDFLLYVPPKA